MRPNPLLPGQGLKSHRHRCHCAAAVYPRLSFARACWGPVLCRWSRIASEALAQKLTQPLPSRKGPAFVTHQLFVSPCNNLFSAYQHTAES